jgi:thymidylate kinase
MSNRLLPPGVLVVLEGLDKTGKTTQAQALEVALDPQTTSHVHMPRGFTNFTEQTYALLESDDRPTSGLARQLAHLACHAESMDRIREILAERAVLLDRWWWSAVAYGWYSGEIPAAGVGRETYMGLVREVWAPLTASVIFLFDQPHELDANNLRRIHEGYQELASEYDDVTVRVPPGDEKSVTTFILDTLGSRGLLAGHG